MNPDIKFMQRALALAQKGSGRVSPNPMVGCVIVRGGKIIAEGFHKKFGGDHAEIAALKKISHKAKGATLYVTLEPCHHFGKTPPCVDAVIRSGVNRVVIAMRDPNPLTAGKSIRKLRQAGINVAVGICQDEAQSLNRFFIKHITTGLPYVIVKVAQSLDGKISAKKGTRSQITGVKSARYVQSLRQSVDAILVGCGTAVIDDPLLNVRDAKKPQPRRVILDSHLRIDPANQLFKSHGGKVFLFCSSEAKPARIRKFINFGAEVFTVTSNASGLDLFAVIKKLGNLGVASVLVEGGSKVFTTFQKSKLVDEWQLIMAPVIIGTKGTPAFCAGAPVLRNPNESKLGVDVLRVAVNR